MSRRIGILGGTFDPIHCGHLDLGAAAKAALDLSTLWVVPTSAPPHRAATVASGFHRFAMVALAIAGRPGWQASDVEMSRAAPSYTFDTLRGFHARGYAPSELFFVIGADAFSDITTWKHYPDILEEAHFAVVSRPGYRVGDMRGRLPALAKRMVEARDPGMPAAPSIILLEARTPDVSSTEIRGRLASGESLTGLVPGSVAQHIEQHGLYTSELPNLGERSEPGKSSAGRLHGQG